LKSSQGKSYPQAVSTGVQNLWDTPKPMRKVIRRLTLGCTLDAYSQHPEFRDLDKNEVSFSYLVKKKKDRKKLRWLLLITSVFATIGASPAPAATYSIDHLKLYAHSRLLDYKEFQCFNKIITQESRWSYTARNGSHYGLGQMRSKHYRDLDPYRQIDATIRYNQTRYVTQCKAWAFHLKHGYY
jgi:hypothetical protein